MSPEQARGLEIDGRSDLFSLGCVLYEMVFGARPFGGASNVDVMASILKDEPEWRSDRDVALPHALGAAISRCLAKERAQRFASARALDAALAEVDRSAVSGLTWPVAAARRPLPAVAVLPIDAPEDDPEVAFLADGVTETLINALSCNPRVRVLPRDVVFRCGRRGDSVATGRALGVAAALSGRVTRCRSVVRVQLELIDVVEGRQRWGGRFVTPLTDLLDAERRIARDVWRVASGVCLQLLDALSP
jgi:serine/threonine-protein kinase